MTRLGRALGAATVTLAAPAGAQSMDHAMPGMVMPAPVVDTAPLDAPDQGTALPAGNGAPPAPPLDHYAERDYPAAVIAPVRAALFREHDGGATHQILFNLAEVQVRDGRNAYRWDAEAWLGGDVQRLVVKSEGEGAAGDRVENAELQALYSRAVDPYWNLQIGARHDFAPGRPATYATIGIEGLAPYWFELGGALFLSDHGNLLARAEAYYDQRITQRLILQPRVELNLAAQAVPRQRLGAGLADAEFGLRLRYELSRAIAPYVGLSYDRRFGRTARAARLAGESRSGPIGVVGMRFWF